jgi:radical SAM superfamily enzyme YgiQ (UPF0313 family)
MTFGFFMIGFPFENRETIKDTIKFARELDCEMVEFNKVIPYQNTELSRLITEGGYALRSTEESNTGSYHEGEITTHRVGDLSPKEVRDLIKMAYREYYLRPRKMLDLIKTFSVSDLFTLTKYAVTTGNI